MIVASYDIIDADSTFATLQYPIKFLRPKEKTVPADKAKFVAVLEPPVYLSDSLARLLGNQATIKSRGNLYLQM
jgi:hypothetical protein